MTYFNIGFAKFVTWGFGTILALVLGGCVVIESDRAGAPASARGQFAERAQFMGSYSLPRKLFHVIIKAKVGEDNKVSGATDIGFEITEANISIVPDANELFRYDFWYAPSIFSKDIVKASITDQLLDSVTISTDDQTGQILALLAKSIGAIQGLGTASGFDTSASGGQTKILSLSIDPTDPASVHAANHAMRNTASLTVRPAPRAVTNFPPCSFSICYRPLTTVTMSFKDRSTGQITEFSAIVPDPHQIAGVDIERSAFVKRDTLLTFASGTLTNVDMTKPSELAGAALLPLSIITAFFEGTNEAVNALVGSRTNTDAQAIKLLNAQADYLEALAKFREREAALKKDIGKDPVGDDPDDDSL